MKLFNYLKEALTRLVGMREEDNNTYLYVGGVNTGLASSGWKIDSNGIAYARFGTEKRNMWVETSALRIEKERAYVV